MHLRTESLKRLTFGAQRGLTSRNLRQLYEYALEKDSRCLFSSLPMDLTITRALRHHHSLLHRRSSLLRPSSLPYYSSSLLYRRSSLLHLSSSLMAL